MKFSAPIELVHNASPGRLRIKVYAIYRSEEAKDVLEKKLSEISYVESVRANSLTGTVLIQFDSTRAATGEVLAAFESLCGPVTTTGPAKSPRATAAKRESLLTQWLQGLAIKSQPEETTPLPAKAKPRNEKPEKYALDPPRQAPPSELWHAQDTDRVLGLLQSSEAGLDSGLARHRLELYGPNLLTESQQRSGLKMFLEQFVSIPVGMLGLSAVISIATGGIADAIVIGGVVLINAVIGYATESSAEKTINALGNLAPTSALVIRDGQQIEIPVEEVVIGDLLVLTPGSYIPADARLLTSNRMTVDESALTGESLPVGKHAERACSPDTPLGERVNMVHMGTVVTGGSGLALVTASGLHTEIGHIQSLVGEVATPETPLQRQLDHMGVQLAALSAGICVVVFGIGILRGFGWLQMLNSSISLAVAAVPEGLPAVATTTLALGIREMQRRQVLIRQLPAVESLGSVQVICLDKTGTLTMNQMKVVALNTDRHTLELRDGVFLADDQAYPVLDQTELQRLLEAVTLCSEVKVIQELGNERLEGSPTECALVEAAVHAGLQVEPLRLRLPLIKLEHRAENRPYMLSVHQEAEGRYLLAVKGSPGEVLNLCNRQEIGGKLVKLKEADKQRILDRNEAMASDALRVLGVAYGHADSAEAGVPTSLIWLGLIGMEDAIRPGMPELMAQFHDAGIETVMITGDQSATAYSVGKRLGLNHDKNLEIIDSINLDRVEPEILANIVKDTSIFSRVSPAHKLRIVQALQGSGRVIAMTGDGINDGPALKAADVGVAMGKHGTDVARSVADVVLEDDNLHTMITAVEQGRTIYNNIRKSLRFLLSTNLSEIEVMLVTTALGVGEALNPMQLLWINLITDIFPALALAMEPPERDVLKQPPRDPDQPIIHRQDVVRLLRESSLITVGCMGVFAYSVGRYGPGMQASTNTFMTLTLAQFLQSISCRSEETTVLDRSRPGNPYLTAAIAGSMGAQALTVLFPPLRGLLRLSPIAMVDLLAIMAGTVLPFIVNEGSKNLRLTPYKEPQRV